MAIEKLIGPKAAGEVLVIKRDTLYKWIAEGKIPFLKIGGALRFRPSALQAWIQEREHAARADSQESAGNEDEETGGVRKYVHSEAGSAIVAAGTSKSKN